MPMPTAVSEPRDKKELGALGDTARRDLLRLFTYASEYLRDGGRFVRLFTNARENLGDGWRLLGLFAHPREDLCDHGREWLCDVNHDARVVVAKQRCLFVGAEAACNQFGVRRGLECRARRVIFGEIDEKVGQAV
jgi:hypothetical protein